MDKCIAVNTRGINAGNRCEKNASRYGYCTSHLRSKFIQKELLARGLDPHEKTVNIVTIPTQTPTVREKFSFKLRECIKQCNISGIEILFDYPEDIRSKECNICPACNLKFTGERPGDSVLKHIKEVHLNEKTFKCDHCAFFCSRKDNLKKHKCKSITNQRNYTEREIKQKLMDELGGRETACAIGRPDLITETEVIEIKTWAEWKKGLGQILIYKLFWPNLVPRLHMFNLPETDITGRVMLAKSITETYGVKWTQE